MFLTSFPAGPFQANCYVFSLDGRRCVVVDPGVNAFDGVKQIVADRGLAVEAVVLTHGHPDHVGSAADVADHFGVPAFIHADDRELFDPSTPGAALAGSIAMAAALALGYATVTGLALRMMRARSFFDEQQAQWAQEA